MGETRSIQTTAAELRLSDDGNTLYGYAALYGVRSKWLGFYEEIAVGAFNRSLEAGDDVVALFNHDPSRVLGRRDSGTLKLSSDNRGLAFSLDLPNSPTGAEVRELVKRSDIRDMSFAFIVQDEDWNTDDGKRIRTLNEVSLRDISVVTDPAYAGTQLSIRGSTMTDPKELYVELRRLTNQARGIMDQERQTGEDQQQLDALFARVDEIEAALQGIANAAKMEAVEAVLEEPTVDASRHRAGALESGDVYGTQEYREAFMSYVRTGDHRELRDMNTSDDSAVVPTDMERTLVEKLDALSVIRPLATTYNWDSNRDVPIEDAIGSAGWTAEAGTITPADASFGTSVSFVAWTATAAVRVTNQLLQDSLAVNMGTYLGAVLGRRFAILLENAYANGDGSSKPAGVIPNAGTAGTTHDIAGGTAFTDIVPDDIIDTVFKLSPQYRSRGRWLFSDAMLKVIRQLKTTTNEYLWRPAERYSDLRDGNPGTVFGYPYTVVDDSNAPSAGASARAAIFGDFSYFWIADRGTTSMLVDPYSQALSVMTDFVSYRRTDSHVVLPEAFSVLKLKAS